MITWIETWNSCWHITIFMMWHSTMSAWEELCVCVSNNTTLYDDVLQHLLNVRLREREREGVGGWRKAAHTTYTLHVWSGSVRKPNAMIVKWMKWAEIVQAICEAWSQHTHFTYKLGSSPSFLSAFCATTNDWRNNNGRIWKILPWPTMRMRMLSSS